jgi:hypothetical protein
VWKRATRPLALEVGCVERTLLSAAFDADFDLDLDFPSSLTLTSTLLATHSLSMERMFGKGTTSVVPQCPAQPWKIGASAPR